MPYQQQLELGSALRYARSDHSISIPRPALDRRLGVVGGCIGCHADRTPGALEAQAARWYGRLKPQHPLVAALLDAEGVDDVERASELLLAPAAERDDFPAGTFAALAHVLERFVRPDAPEISERTMSRLRRLAARRDPDVRALALATLHYARGGDPAVRRVLVDALRGLQGEEEWLVRRRWALVLAYLGDRARRAKDPATAVTAYTRALEVMPSDAPLLTSLGLALADGGDRAAAAARYRESLAIDGTQSLTLVNLGVVLEAQGDAAGAAEAYTRAAAINPHEALAHLNLGNLLLRQGRAADAIPLYERAVAADPAHGLAMLRTLEQLGAAR
jgi:tetratricopeptide (TPR) repeat protein